MWSGRWSPDCGEHVEVWLGKSSGCGEKVWLDRRSSENAHVEKQGDSMLADESGQLLCEN